MAPNADPWRTLGLAPGATQDEIRRAYRRLAKINHPDAAGDGALPRFLAIQQAYDQLAGPGRLRRTGGRPAPATPPAAEPREPWRADPGRARASGRADGRRAPGARPTSPPGSTGGPNSGATGGASRGSADPADGTAAGSASPGSRRSSSRRRASNRATPGSTSYEGADQEPFEPGWSGATWYGASSGTYWTINPKEYADPRKHGPEYQARARRATRTGRLEDGASEPSGPDGSSASPADGPAGRGPGPAPDIDGVGGPEPTPSATGPVGGDAPDAHGAAADPGAAESTPAAQPPNRMHRPSTTRPPRTSATPRRAGAAARASEASWPPRAPSAQPADRPGAQPPGDARQRDPGAGAGPPPVGPPRFGSLRDFVEEPPSGRFRAPILREPTTPMGRLAMALLGWPPLGIFLAAAIDGSTGCGRYAASCSEISSPGTWIVNAVLVLLLLALPRLAAWSAHGTIVALVVGVPAAVALSAGGGSNVPESSGPVLITVLALAYLAGVAYAVVRQAQLRFERIVAGRRVP